MAVEGKKGAHVELLRKYGSGSIYRLCFKTDNLEACFGHLEASGTKATNLEGVPFNSFQDVMNSGKRILWLQREGELSMEILTAPIIDSGCAKTEARSGFRIKSVARMAAGPLCCDCFGCSVRYWSFLWQSLHAVMYCSGKPSSLRFDHVEASVH